MSAILTPVGLLLIMLAGYLFKRFGLFGQKDYRVLQTAEFNIVLPGPSSIRLLPIRTTSHCYGSPCSLFCSRRSPSCSFFWPHANAM